MMPGQSVFVCQKFFVDKLNPDLDLVAFSYTEAEIGVRYLPFRHRTINWGGKATLSSHATWELLQTGLSIPQ